MWVYNLHRGIVLGTDVDIHGTAFRGNSGWLCMAEKSSDGRRVVREISRQVGRGHIRKVFFSIIRKNLKLIPNLDLGDILKYLSHPTIS